MKTKQTIVLLIMAVALLLLAVWYKNREKAIEEEVAAVTKTVISDLTSGTVERIVITTSDGTTTSLTRKATVWYTDPVKGHKADSNLVGSVFSTIDKEIVGEVVATNPETFGDYQVNETSATHVVFYGAGSSPIEDLYIGKNGPSYNSTYVRKANTDEVLNVNASLSFMFNKPDGWRDRAIFDIPVDSIVGIAGEGTSGTYELKKVGKDWRVEKPESGPAKAEKAQSMASMLSSLRVSEFIDVESSRSLAEFGLDPPQQKITVTREDTATSPPTTVSDVLLLGTPKEALATFYAKRADADSVFTISKYQADTLAPTPTDLLPPKPEPEETPTSGTLQTTTTAAAAVTTVQEAPAATPAPAASSPETTAPTAMTDTASAAITPAAGETTTGTEAAKQSEPATVTPVAVPTTTTTGPRTIITVSETTSTM